MHLELDAPLLQLFLQSMLPWFGLEGDPPAPDARFLDAFEGV
jgi:hypothetical protein